MMAQAEREMEYSDREQGFDLLEILNPSKKSPDFEVKFALYKAMNQLIIIQRDHDTWKDLDDLEDSYLQEFLRVVKETASSCEQHDLILSIHRGTFIRRQDKFHAHIAFGEDKDNYLKIFERTSNHPTMRTFWPSKDFVTSSWNIKPEDESLKSLKEMNAVHARNVRNNPRWNYRQNDYPSVHIMFDNPRWNPSKNIREFQGTQLIFHRWKPQIGLPWPSTLLQKDYRNKARFVRMLNELAEHIGVSGPEAESGCHLCVKIACKGWIWDESAPPVYGYLHLPGDKFYTACPEDLRETWFLNGFKNWDGKIYT